MPRESIHWHVLNSATRKLEPEFTDIRELVQSNRSLGELGAVAHDAPYYLRLGKSDFQHVSERLHGADRADSFQPIRDFVDAIRKTRHSSAWSFAAGLLSHIATDATFHPMIFYFTGNYHAADTVERCNARTRHRLIEVFLDSWVRKKFEDISTRLISSLLNDSENVARVIDLLAELPSLSPYASPPDARALWKSSLDTMVQLQRLFLSRTCGALVRPLRNISTLRELDSLFLYKRESVPRFLDGTFIYKNPVTGDTVTTTCAELFDASVNESVRLIAELSRCLKDPKREFAKGETGPSLDSGLIRTAAIDLRYFSPEILDFLKR